MPWAGATTSTDALLAIHLLRNIQCALGELGLALDHDIVEPWLRVREEDPMAGLQRLPLWQ
jgi:hypothetical protein